MALKKEALTKIATLLKIKETDLETAIKDEKEVDLTIDDKLQVFNDTEITTLKNNEYSRGKEAGVEIEIKEAKTKLGLDFAGKTIEGLLGAHKVKVIADEKLAPDEKVKAFETKIATMEGTIKTQEKALADKESEVSGVKINSELYKHIPAPGDNGPALSQDNIITLIKADGYEFKQENGVIKVLKGGQLVQDKLGNPLPVKDVVSGFLTEKKLVADPAQPGGRGKGNEGGAGGKYTKLSEIKAKYTAEGKSHIGQEFAAAVKEAQKDKDFDMNA